MRKRKTPKGRQIVIAPKKYGFNRGAKGTILLKKAALKKWKIRTVDIPAVPKPDTIFVILA